MEGPDAYPLMSIYRTEQQAVARSKVADTVDDRMSEYLQEGYLEKVYDVPRVKMIDPEADQAVRLTEKGENALRETLEERGLEHLVAEELE